MSSNSKSLSMYTETLRTLRRRHRPAVLFFLCLMGVFVLAAIAWPRNYESEGKLFVRQTVKHIADDPSVTNDKSLLVQPSREFEINSIVEILRSQAIAEKVVDKIGAAVILRKDDVRTGASANQHVDGENDEVHRLREKATRVLTSAIGVGTPKESTIVNISCKTHDPKLSQQIVNVLMESYLEEHDRVNRTDGSYDFFEEQTALLKNKLDKAYAALRDAKNEADVITIVGKQESLQKQIGEIELDLISSNRNLATSRATVAALSHAVSQLPTRLTTDEVNGMANQAFDAMRHELYKLEAVEEGLVAQYTEEHPKVIAARQQLAELREIIEKQENRRTEVTTSPNLNRQQLELTLLEQKAATATTEARVNKLEQQHILVLEKLNALNAAEILIGNLQQDVDVAKANYQRYVDKLEQARMYSEMETDRISNVKIVQYATLRFQPVGPRKMLLLALGLLISLVGSIGLALFLESQDQSLKSREEIEQHLELPVLVSIPRMSNQPVQLN